MKNLFFGLAVAFVALSASAFTNAKSKSLASPFLVQSVDKQFRPITSAEPKLDNCSGSATLNCYYERVPGQTLPAPTNGIYYTPVEITSYLSSGIIVAGANSFPALYVP